MRHERENHCHFDYNRFSSFTFTGRASGIHKHISNHHIHSFIQSFQSNVFHVFICSLFFLFILCTETLFSVLLSNATIVTFSEQNETKISARRFFFLHFYFLNKHINSIRIQCTSSTVIQILLRYFAAVRHAAAHINNQKT